MFSKGDFVISWSEDSTCGLPGIIAGYGLGFGSDYYKVNVHGDIYEIRSKDLEMLYRLGKNEHIVRVETEEDDDGSPEVE